MRLLFSRLLATPTSIRTSSFRALLLFGLVTMGFLLFYLPFSGAIASPVLQVGPTQLPITSLLECDDDGYCGIFEIDGDPTAMTWFSNHQMYISTYEGDIWLLDLETGGQRMVKSGLVIPQGLVVLNGELFVSELNNLCTVLEDHDALSGSFERCRSRWRQREKMLEVFPKVSARVLAYQIQPDGSITSERTVLDGLPTVDRDHSIHSVITDGEYLYMPVGNPQGTTEGWIYDDGGIEELNSLGVRTEFFGSVIRFRPDGSDLSVYAHGFRNVYDIDFGPYGTMYGTDNGDSGSQMEELNAIHEGGFYGFPQFGTNEAPPDAGVTEPLAVMEGGGSAGITTTDEGVYTTVVQDDGVVNFFRYGEWEPSVVWEGGSYITALIDFAGLLFVLDFDGILHVIEPQEGETIEAREP